MATERQTDANRRNARYSTGPRTPEGRSASRLNGLVHGLRSQLIVIPGENPAEFHALFDGFVDEARPESLRDLAAVRKIASCEWRLRRVAAIENEMFTQTLQQAATIGPALGPFSNDPEQLIAQILSAPPVPPQADASPLTLIARHFLAGGINRFTALSRYEASLERQYRNAWRELDSRPMPDSGASTTTTQFEDICWTYDPATDDQPPSQTEPAAEDQTETAQPNPIPKSDTSSEPPKVEPENLENEPPAAPQPAESEPVIAPKCENAQPNPIPKSDTSGEPSRSPRIDPYGPRPEDLRDFIEWVRARARLLGDADPEETQEELDSAA